MPTVGSSDDPADGELLARVDEALSPARHAGVLGSASVEQLVAHARGYLHRPWFAMYNARLADCGTGSGVLGILLALELPESRWTLIDSSERRCDLTQGAVACVGLAERVKVEHARIEDLARHPSSRSAYDGVVSRMFGPAAELAECALPLLKPDGRLVLSVTDETSQPWHSTELASLTGCEMSDSWSTPFGSYLAIRRVAPTPERLPRRTPARQRSPLL